MKNIKYLALGALAFWPIFAPAMEPPPELGTYEYGDIFLVRTIVTDKTAMACFVTYDGKTLWAQTGALVGDRLGKVAKIENNFVVISEMLQVNGGEWARSTFDWPVTERKDLLEHCSQPPSPPGPPSPPSPPPPSPRKAQ